jgi:hypothetical protein
MLQSAYKVWVTSVKWKNRYEGKQMHYEVGVGETGCHSFSQMRNEDVSGSPCREPSPCCTRTWKRDFIEFPKLKTHIMLRRAKSRHRLYHVEGSHRSGCRRNRMFGGCTEDPSIQDKVKRFPVTARLIWCDCKAFRLLLVNFWSMNICRISVDFPWVEAGQNTSPVTLWDIGAGLWGYNLTTLSLKLN